MAPGKGCRLVQVSEMTRDPRSHPLAPCQEMLWLLHEVGQPGPAYGMPLAARLEGELDREALQRAVHAVVDRHPPLRSVVEVDQGVARLRPLDAGMVAGLVHHDLTSVAEGDRPAAAWEVFRQACCEAFDLRRGPLVRFHLVHEAPRAWTLLAVPHHIVFDGISKANFVRELSQCYRALVAQEEPGLAPLRSSYAEHAREEGDRLPGLVSQLAEDLGALGPVETGPQLLPFDRSRPAELSGMGGCVNILLDEPLHVRLA